MHFGWHFGVHLGCLFAPKISPKIKWNLHGFFERFGAPKYLPKVTQKPTPETLKNYGFPWVFARIWDPWEPPGTALNFHRFFAGFWGPFWRHLGIPFAIIFGSKNWLILALIFGRKLHPILDPIWWPNCHRKSIELLIDFWMQIGSDFGTTLGIQKASKIPKMSCS